MATNEDFPNAFSFAWPPLLSKPPADDFYDDLPVLVEEDQLPTDELDVESARLARQIGALDAMGSKEEEEEKKGL